MNTVLEMIGLLVITLLYALAWHNQPVREPAPVRHTAPKAEGQTARTLNSRSCL